MRSPELSAASRASLAQRIALSRSPASSATRDPSKAISAIADQWPWSHAHWSASSVAARAQRRGRSGPPVAGPRGRRLAQAEAVVELLGPRRIAWQLVVVAIGPRVGPGDQVVVLVVTNEQSEHGSAHVGPVHDDVIV